MNSGCCTVGAEITSPSSSIASWRVGHASVALKHSRRKRVPHAFAVGAAPEADRDAPTGVRKDSRRCVVLEDLAGATGRADLAEAAAPGVDGSRPARAARRAESRWLPRRQPSSSSRRRRSWSSVRCRHRRRDAGEVWSTSSWWSVLAVLGAAMVHPRPSWSSTPTAAVVVEPPATVVVVVVVSGFLLGSDVTHGMLNWSSVEDRPQVHLTGDLDQLLGLRLVLDTGQVDDDGVALTQDLRLGDAEAVDTLADPVDSEVEAGGVEVTDRLLRDRDATLQVEAERG